MLEAELIVMRHALALPSQAAGVEYDAQRPLAPQGHQAAAAIGRALAGLGLGPHRCVCSPLVRARETAEAVLAAAGSEFAPELDAALAPGCGVDDLLLAASAGGTPMLAVIHEPDVSRVLAAVLGRPWPFAILPADCFALRIHDGDARLVVHLSPERAR